MFYLDEDKIERVLYEHEKTKKDHGQRFDQLERLISQVLCTTFTSQGGDRRALGVGPKVITINVLLELS